MIDLKVYIQFFLKSAFVLDKTLTLANLYKILYPIYISIRNLICSFIIEPQLMPVALTFYTSIPVFEISENVPMLSPQNFLFFHRQDKDTAIFWFDCMTLFRMHLWVVSEESLVL